MSDKPKYDELTTLIVLFARLTGAWQSHDRPIMRHYRTELQQRGVRVVFARHTETVPLGRPDSSDGGGADATS